MAEARIANLICAAASTRRVRAPAQSYLTKRQRDCVVLVARGKSDREIGEALGISTETAHKHVENAKQRFAVGTRVELVVRALLLSELELTDVVA